MMFWNGGAFASIKPNPMRVDGNWSWNQTFWLKSLIQNWPPSMATKAAKFAKLKWWFCTHRKGGGNGKTKR